MLCGVCQQKEAGAHLTQTGTDKQVDPYEDCAKATGINAPTSLSLADLLNRPVVDKR